MINLTDRLRAMGGYLDYDHEVTLGSIADELESQQAEIQRLNEVIKLMEQNEVYLHKDYNDKLARFGNPKIGSIYCTVGNYDYQLQVLDAYPTEHGMSIKVDAIKEITRLTTIIKENEADAKRYRFMRDNDITDIYSDWVTYKLSPYYFDIVDLDKYIDQAMTDLVNPMLSIEAMRVKGE